MIGEIDCREGLVVAVERGIYSSIEEGICATLKVIKGIIINLIQKKKLRVFIHPVNPVLDLTRHIVVLFNHHYRQIVSDIKGCYWLDFFDSLLVQTPGVGDNNVSLKEEWKLDGTHLNPGYVSLLEESFWKLQQS